MDQNQEPGNQESRKPGILTETHQHVNAVCADDTDNDCADYAEAESSVLESIRHREDPRPQAALEEVQKGARVTRKDSKLHQIRGYIYGKL